MGKTGLVASAAIGIAFVGCLVPTESCFVRGTKVRGPSGVKNIEDLEVGDDVFSFNESTMQLVVRKVTALHRAQVERVRTIHVGDRSKVITTDAHPFWEAERKIWMRAGELQPGATLAVLVEGRLVPKTIERIEDADEPQEVFNLTVEGPEHTYLADDIAVHNKSRPCPPIECQVAVRDGGSTADVTVPEQPWRGSEAIAIRNDENLPILVEVDEESSTQEMAISEGVLTKTLPFAIPEDTFKASEAKSFTLAPGEVRGVPTSIVRVLTIRGEEEEKPGVILRVDRKAALYVGRGIAYVSGKYQEDVRLSPLGRNDQGQTCQDELPPQRLVLPKVETAWIGQSFTMESKTTAAGCMTIGLKLTQPAAQTEIKICGSETLWPYTQGDALKVELPLKYAGEAGVRLTRVSDSKTIELVHVVQPSALLTEPDNRVLAQEHEGCIPRAKVGCAALTVRPSLVDQGTRRPVASETPLPMRSGGYIELLSGTVPLFKVGCQDELGYGFDIIVH